MRRARTLLLLLVAGAIVNVAVAWGCAIYSPVGIAPTGGASHFKYIERDDPDVAELRDNASFVRFSRYCESGVGFRLALVNASGTARGSLQRGSCGIPFRGLTGTLSRLEGQWAPRSVDTVESPILSAWLPHGRYGLLRDLRTPLWPGFTINTVFYAVVLWLLFAGPFVLRRWRRIRRGLCPKCAYDLRGSKEATACPECGAAMRSAAGKTAVE